jgi:N-acetylmuramoyl-L-alanine amidase
MRWSSWLVAGALLITAAAPVEEKRITIYSTAANYSLPVVERDSREYVGLLEVLEPLGSVGARQDRDRWKLRFQAVDAEFIPGKAGCKLQGRDFDLPARFLLENGRGLIPLAALSTVMPRLLGGPVTFHETSRRLFIGNVSVHFTAQVRKTTPPALVMDFTSPVNPRISTEPGKLRMVFTREPLVPPGTQTLTFGDKTIPAASYSEANGAAEIAITGTVPLFASFSNDGRTITITPTPPPSAHAQSPAQISSPAAAGQAVSAQAPSAASTLITPPAGGRRYFAVIDAGHGGDERGAALTDQLAEKDVTLAFARRLREDLENRGLATLLLRDSDVSLSLDQRAALTNAVRPAIYISVHATSQGSGVRLYTAMLPASGANHGPFLDWNAAQSSFLPLSQLTASGVFAEFRKRQVPVRVLAAPLRPLNTVAAAALAVEAAPPASAVGDLNSSAYQELVADAVATGVLAVRDKLEAGR